MLPLGTKAENSKALGQYGKYVCEVKRTLKKKNKQRQYKKPLRRISIVVTPQTDYHLCELCAMNGWGEKDKGRVVDKLVTIHQAATKGGRFK